MPNTPDNDYALYLDDVYDRTIDALNNEHFDDERVRAIYDAAAAHLTPDDCDAIPDKFVAALAAAGLLVTPETHAPCDAALLELQRDWQAALANQITPEQRAVLDAAEAWADEDDAIEDACDALLAAVDAYRAVEHHAWQRANEAPTVYSTNESTP